MLQNIILTNEHTTYMTCILQKLWPKTDLKQVPDIWIAYAASTSEILLNPSIPTIQISEEKIETQKISESCGKDY